jgi:hypothetical protein
MAPLGIAGAALGCLLASSLGLGCVRLDAQGREALVAHGRQLFGDKGCYGLYTIGVAGTPIGPTSAPWAPGTGNRPLRGGSASHPLRRRRGTWSLTIRIWLANRTVEGVAQSHGSWIHEVGIHPIEDVPVAYPGLWVGKSQ